MNGGPHPGNIPDPRVTGAQARASAEDIAQATRFQKAQMAMNFLTLWRPDKDSGQGVVPETHGASEARKAAHQWLQDFFSGDTARETGESVPEFHAVARA